MGLDNPDGDGFEPPFEIEVVPGENPGEEDLIFTIQGDPISFQITYSLENDELTSAGLTVGPVSYDIDLNSGQQTGQFDFSLNGQTEGAIEFGIGSGEVRFEGGITIRF